MPARMIRGRWVLARPGKGNHRRLPLRASCPPSPAGNREIACCPRGWRMWQSRRWERVPMLLLAFSSRQPSHRVTADLAGDVGLGISDRQRCPRQIHHRPSAVKLCLPKPSIGLACWQIHRGQPKAMPPRSNRPCVAPSDMVLNYTTRRSLPSKNLPTLPQQGVRFTFVGSF